MKKGISLNQIESLENAKSTNENTTNGDKNKSIQKSKKVPEVLSIKRKKNSSLLKH